ncbi:hypothetical protein LRH25_30780 [Ideonella azotifigens]|uniref:DUF3011 domain-containing protein n=1 Tax=Ideonella azotifigens TaxID=513160 RepID=A0ABN1JGY4_9BURK|nr:hypothetical protein [Ideonella azotifigens]MCD2344709.1 hypothetical protein [Ideonella azotifigens]
MNAVRHLAAVIAIALAATTASAQFVKGNEAVKLMPDGSKRAETAPLPSTGPIRSTKRCNADAGCNAGPWHMVETNDGLVECTEAYARPGTCRKSTFGTTRHSRLWVVKFGNNWLQCQFPDLGSKCVNMFARPPANLPFDAVQ